jgi:AhpD family alkylhydroperoxidase
MPRLVQIAPESATGKSNELLDKLQQKLGRIPNISRGMANSPAVLDGYMGMSGALSKVRLSPKTREQIALAVGQANGCNDCLAAHSAIGKMVGLTDDQIRLSRHGKATNLLDELLMRLARNLVVDRGWIADDRGTWRACQRLYSDKYSADPPML